MSLALEEVYFSDQEASFIIIFLMTPTKHYGIEKTTCTLQFLFKATRKEI